MADSHGRDCVDNSTDGRSQVWQTSWGVQWLVRSRAQRRICPQQVGLMFRRESMRIVLTGRCRLSGRKKNVVSNQMRQVGCEFHFDVNSTGRIGINHRVRSSFCCCRRHVRKGDKLIWTSIALAASAVKLSSSIVDKFPQDGNDDEGHNEGGWRQVGWDQRWNSAIWRWRLVVGRIAKREGGGKDAKTFGSWYYWGGFVGEVPITCNGRRVCPKFNLGECEAGVQGETFPRVWHLTTWIGREHFHVATEGEVSVARWRHGLSCRCLMVNPRGHSRFHTFAWIVMCSFLFIPEMQECSRIGRTWRCHAREAKTRIFAGKASACAFCFSH